MLPHAALARLPLTASLFCALCARLDGGAEVRMHLAPAGAMTCTLKDLAPAEKQKVARLIKQVVEKERQLRELEEAFEAAKREGEQGAGAGADANVAAKAEQLAEQNQELARENTR